MNVKVVRVVKINNYKNSDIKITKNNIVDNSDTDINKTDNNNNNCDNEKNSVSLQNSRVLVVGGGQTS